MNDQERAEWIAKSVKARKLILPPHLQNLPFQCPNIQLLTDETCSAIDERYDMFADFISELSTEIGIQSSVWSMDEYHDFTVNPFPSAIGVSYRGGWGKAGQIKFSKKPQNVTLLDVWKACDKLIDRSGDHHHVFIETLEQKGDWIAFECGS